MLIHKVKNSVTLPCNNRRIARSLAKRKHLLALGATPKSYTWAIWSFRKNLGAPVWEFL